MSKKQKKNLERIVRALILFLLVFIITKLVEIDWKICFILYLSVYLYVGYDVIIRAFKNIIRGNVLDENFLMVIATFGAFSLGIYNGITKNVVECFNEGCAVILFYKVGEWFEDYAVRNSRKNIAKLMDIKAAYANVKTEEGFKEVSPEEVKVHDIILVKPGEKIALDGKIVQGDSCLDCKSLTGESMPINVGEGSSVLSGSINLTNSILVLVEKEYENCTVKKILDLVENATNKKSKSENFISRFSRYYTPTVVIIAFLLAFIPSLLTRQFAIWLYRSLSFLVVSCPCALVISIPLTFFNGIGKASKLGVLVKGSVYLEEFEKVKTFVFDKTGTLTKGNFSVLDVQPLSKKEEILKYAAIAEDKSTHPIALSIKKAYGKAVDEGYQNTEISGQGIIAKKEDVIYCGNAKLMQENKIVFEKTSALGTIIYVALNNEYLGYIVIGDEIKKNSKQVIGELNKNYQTVMLSGDNELIVQKVAEEIGVFEYHANLLPNDKVNIVEKLKKEGNVCFVGDGINDAPVMMLASIGICMGQIGTDAAIEASDIVLMKDDLSSILEAKKLANKIMKIVKENIYFAIGVKVIILILSGLGITNMWFAVFGDVGVAIIAILNSLR